MKIRLGFISNSSSASYIINLKGNKDDIIENIVSCLRILDYNGLLEKRIQDSLKIERESLKRIETTGERFLGETLESIRANIKVLESDLTKVSDTALTKAETIDLVFRNFGIKYNWTLNGLRFSYYTAIHSSYMEGMPDFLKEIVLLYKFEHPELIRCKFKSDNS